MLVLSRKKEEIIVIECGDGTTIAFAIIEIRGNKVRVGIDATSDVGIYRKEVYDEILAERKRAIDSPESIARREAENRIDPDFGKDHS